MPKHIMLIYSHHSMAVKCRILLLNFWETRMFVKHSCIRKNTQTHTHSDYTLKDLFLLWHKDFDVCGRSFTCPMLSCYILGGDGLRGSDQCK